jgi:apolipoprotein N-acyltransferase
LSLKKYKDLIFQAQGELIILPETSIPLIYQKIPISFMQSLQEKMNATKSKIILGAIYKENSQYFNSAVYLHDNSINLYHKYHLVPFGEYIPLRPLLKFVYENWLQIPFNDLSRGTKKQALFKFNNNQIAANICYEDVFGNEIIRPFPNATMLVNLSNDAWYGQSNAAFQHLQISQARAIETGRMMLRATNTGATAIINEKGEIISHLPHFDVGILEGYAQGYEGETPYSKYGNYLIVLLSIMGVILSLKRKT